MFARVLMLLALASLWPPLLRSDLFVTHQGEKGISIKYLSWDTDHFWTKGGSRERTWSRFKRKEIETHLEYGLTCWDTIGFKGAYDTVNEELDGKTCGITDFELSWRRFILGKGPNAFYARLIGVIPPESGYKPCLRYGQYGLEGDVIYTRSFNVAGFPAFFYGDIGYRWYEGFPSDQVRNKLACYVCLHRRFQLVARSELHYGVYNGKSRLDQSLVWMNPNFRLWKGEIEGVFHLYRCADISAGYFQHLWGRNVGTGGGVITKVTFIF